MVFGRLFLLDRSKEHKCSAYSLNGIKIDLGNVLSVVTFFKRNKCRSRFS